MLHDVIGADAEFGERSRAVLERCAESGVLIINPVIYAEVCVFIDTVEEADELLPPALFRRDAIRWEASFLAGKAIAEPRGKLTSWDSLAQESPPPLDPVVRITSAIVNVPHEIQLPRHSGSGPALSADTFFDVSALGPFASTPAGYHLPLPAILAYLPLWFQNATRRKACLL